METFTEDSDFDWKQFQGELEDLKLRFKKLFLDPKDEVPVQQLNELLVIYIKLSAQQRNLLEKQEDQLAEQSNKLLALVEKNNFWLYATIIQNASDKIEFQDRIIARNSELLDRFSKSE
jgi:hypothetical protein